MSDEQPPILSSADLGSVLDAVGLGDEIVAEVAGLGASLVLTSNHLVVVRQGAHFRPRSGIRALPFIALREVRLEPPKHGSGRLILRIGRYPWHAISVFIGARDWDAAERLASLISIRIAQARRSQRSHKQSEILARTADPDEPD
jgi:hypothetical protein